MQHHCPPLASAVPSRVIKLRMLTDACPHNSWGWLRWSSAIIGVTAHFTCCLVSDLVIWSWKEYDAVYDDKCPYWDYVSFNNANLVFGVSQCQCLNYRFWECNVSVHHWHCAQSLAVILCCGVKWATCTSIQKSSVYVWIQQLDVLTLKVLVATIYAQWEGMGDVGSARYEPALLPPYPTIRVLSYSN